MPQIPGGTPTAYEQNKKTATYYPARGVGGLNVQTAGSDSLDILQQQCENCIRVRRKECTKTKGDACDPCSRQHKKCSLTEAVKAYRKSIGNPRGRSRSRSVGAKAKSRTPKFEEHEEDVDQIDSE